MIVGYSYPGDGLDSVLKPGKALIFDRTKNLEADIARLTAAIVGELETQIRQLPEHCFYL
ncbi:hypothetical protein GCM10008020_42460 [Massilia psychrophila]|nr:hypothetical protein GCM10008020_42460 [Massilia psychrophila]